MSLKTEYIGKVPNEVGNYYVVNLTNRDQFLARLFVRDDKKLVLSCDDHREHPVTDYDNPNYRWIRIEPLTTEQMDQFLFQPVA